MGVKREPTGSKKNTAPLQKRLAGISQGKVADDKKKRRASSSDEGLPGKGLISRPNKSSRGKLVDGVRRESKPGGSTKDPKSDRSSEKTKPTEPFKMSLPKSKIKLTLTTAKTTTKPNSAVLEKLGMTNEDLAEAKKALKRKAELENTEAAKKAKTDSMALMETLKERLKNKVEAGKTKPAGVEKTKVKAAPVTEPIATPPVVTTPVKLKEKKAKAKDGADARGRREELLKQLKAVEDAIHRKRTKLDG